MTKIAKLKLLTVILVSLSLYAKAQTNIFPSSGPVGIGTTTPATLLEVKKGIEWGTNGTQYVAPYSLGNCNDYGAAQPDQYLLLTPYINAGTGSVSAGLSGKLTFYRGTAGSTNLVYEYDVHVQAAYKTTITDIVPLTSLSNVLNVYKITYFGVDYVALYMRDVIAPSTSSVAVNFQGHFWNFINTQKPQLVLASDVTTATVIKSYQPAYGDLMFASSTGKIGLGTSSPRANFDVGYTTNNVLSSVLARLSEGDGNVDGTYLGVRALNTQPNYTNSFSIEHKFNNNLNSSINFYRGGSSIGGFLTFTTNNGTERMRIDANGNVLIGKTTQVNTSYKLDVSGNVRADKMVVNTTGADFVFDSSYRLRSLSEVELFVQQNHHLPDIAPATEMQQQGADLGENQTKLLQKVEELTLYLIEQDKVIKELKKQVELLKKNSKHTE